MTFTSKFDPRCALRALALGLLALVIGVHSAGFSFAEQMFLEHLPVRDPGSIGLLEAGRSGVQWGLEAALTPVSGCRAR